MISIIGSIYPNYKPMSIDIAIEAWRAIFSNIPYNVVVGALYSYAKNNNEFPPTPGQINHIIEEATNPNAINEEEAWDMVRKAASNGYYNSQAEFDKLPEIIQNTIRTPHFIYTLSQLDHSALTVEKSFFVKSYRNEIEKQRHLENLPNSAIPHIENMKSKTPQVENRQEVAMLETKQNYQSLVQAAKDKFMNGENDIETERVPENLEEIKGGGLAEMLRDKLNVTATEAEEIISCDSYEIQEAGYEQMEFDEQMFA